MMRKPLILHVINGLGSGGAEALLFRLTTRNSNFEHEVIALATRDWYTPLLEKAGVKVHHLDITSAATAMGGVMEFWRLVRGVNADLIQGWMYGSNLLAGLAARSRKLPSVWSIHASTLEGLGAATRICARLGGIFNKWLAHCVINCSMRSSQLHSRMGYSSGRTVVVPNGYDPAVFFPDAAKRFAARSALGLPKRAFVVGAIARWNARKNVPNLLEALGILKCKGVPFRAVLIGTGLDFSNPELLDWLISADLIGSISALGQRSDLVDIARALDLHVLPSSTEAFPNVVAETMLSETPNVVTDVGDASLIVGDSGWVVPPRDPQSLALSIQLAYQEWKDRPDVWLDRKKRARDLIVERFTFERMAQQYERIWSELIEHR